VHLIRSFTIHVNGGIESFTIADPPSSAWTLAKTSGDVKYITLGTGGRADPWPIAGEVILGVGAVAAAAVALFYGGKWLAAQIMSFLPWSALLWIGRTLGRQSLVNKYTGEAGSIISGSSGGSASIFGFDSLAGSVISAFATDSEDSEDPTESLIAPIRAFDFFPTIMGAVGKEAEANMTSQLIRRADPDLSNATDALLNFSSVYDTLVGDREACILGQKFWWSYDCLVVGTSIVIQTDGKALAVPLPNIYRAWD
jgi:hypothetical protein